jgi:hypothetical protein
MPVIVGEIELHSLKVVDKDFLLEIDAGLNAYEVYLLKEFGPDVTFPYVSHH